MDKKELLKEIDSLKSRIEILGKEVNAGEKWVFTEDEKVILRNLPEEYKWIARDKGNRSKLFIYSDKPVKERNFWSVKQGQWELFSFEIYNHLFQSIKWEDDEPCEFKKYI